MAEWHIDWIYIRQNWSVEFLMLMVDRLVERKEEEAAAITGKKTRSKPSMGYRDWLALTGGKVKKIVGKLGNGKKNVIPTSPQE